MTLKIVPFSKISEDEGINRFFIKTEEANIAASYGDAVISLFPFLNFPDPYKKKDVAEMLLMCMCTKDIQAMFVGRCSLFTKSSNEHIAGMAAIFFSGLISNADHRNLYREEIVAAGNHLLQHKKPNVCLDGICLFHKLTKCLSFENQDKTITEIKKAALCCLRHPSRPVSDEAFRICFELVRKGQHKDLFEGVLDQYRSEQISSPALVLLGLISDKDPSVTSIVNQVRQSRPIIEEETLKRRLVQIYEILALPFAVSYDFSARYIALEQLIRIVDQGDVSKEVEDILDYLLKQPIDPSHLRPFFRSRVKVLATTFYKKQEEKRKST